MAVSIVRALRTASLSALLSLTWAIAQAELPVTDWTGGLGPTDAEVGNEMPQTLRFGSALATDGPTVLSGMPEYRDARGRVAVFRHQGPGRWTRTGTLSASDGLPGDLFGIGVAVSGDFALVTSQRAVYVFRRANGKWSQVRRFGVRQTEWLTGAVQVSPDLAAIGVTSESGLGSVMLLQRDAQGLFQLLGRLRAFDREAFDGFGESVALGPNRLVVGAPGKHNSKGAVYVFERKNLKWSETQKLVPFDGSSDGAFGKSVALQGNTLVAGAPDTDHETGFYSGYEYLHGGAAYVFTLKGTRYQRLQKLRPTPEENIWYYDFGENVALTKNRLAVAAAWPVTRWDASFIFLYQLQGGTYRIESMFAGEASTGDDIALSDRALIAGVPFDPYYSIGYAVIHEFGFVERAQP